MFLFLALDLMVVFFLCFIYLFIYVKLAAFFLSQVAFQMRFLWAAIFLSALLS